MVRVVVIVLLLAGQVMAQSRPPVFRPKSIELPRAERDILDLVVDDFVHQWEAQGDIRKVSAELLHPLWSRPACDFLPFVAPEVCVQLTPEERRDYGHSYLNTMWMTFEHQNALNAPPWFRQPDTEEIPEEHEIFIPEVIPFLMQLRGAARTVAEFRQRMPQQLEYERRLQTYRSRRKPIESSTYVKNFQLVDEAMSQSRGRIVPLTQLGVSSVDGFAVIKAFFGIVVVRDQGRFKIAWVKSLRSDF